LFISLLRKFRFVNDNSPLRKIFSEVSLSRKKSTSRQIFLEKDSNLVNKIFHGVAILRLDLIRNIKLSRQYLLYSVRKKIKF